jgi:exodeoxyribonuclease VIII
MPGIYTDLSNEEYHADKSSLSRSSLKDFYRSPHYYWSMHLNPNRPKRIETDEMRFGTAFHKLILEPNTFEMEYAIKPERVLLKDVGRDKYEAYKSECDALENSGKIVLSDEDMITLHEMAMALVRNDKAKQLLSDGEIEKSFFWADSQSDITLKARPDILQNNMIIDVKTIADASYQAYQRSMVSGWYHVQGAMIRDAIRKFEDKDISNVINICVEKKYPYSVGIYLIDEAALDEGERMYKNILLHLRDCLINNDFRDLEIRTVELPKWALL